MYRCRVCGVTESSLGQNRNDESSENLLIVTRPHILPVCGALENPDSAHGVVFLIFALIMKLSLDRSYDAMLWLSLILLWTQTCLAEHGSTVKRGFESVKDEYDYI